MAWEISFLQWIQELHNPILDQIMVVITHLGNGGIFWILVALGLIITKKYRNYGWMMAAAMALGLILGNGLLKNLIARPRPFAVAPIGDLLIAFPKDWSFPSGHTLVSFEAAGILLYMNKKAGIFALVVAACIAFSRMYLYVHYPTDILGGLLLALFNVFVVIKVYEHFTNRKLQQEA